MRYEKWIAVQIMEWISYVQVKVALRFCSTDFNSCSTCFSLSIHVFGQCSRYKR